MGCKVGCLGWEGLQQISMVCSDLGAEFGQYLTQKWAFKSLPEASALMATSHGSGRHSARWIWFGFGLCLGGGGDALSWSWGPGGAGATCLPAGAAPTRASIPGRPAPSPAPAPAALHLLYGKPWKEIFSGLWVGGFGVGLGRSLP